MNIKITEIDQSAGNVIHFSGTITPDEIHKAMNCAWGLSCDEFGRDVLNMLCSELHRISLGETE